MKYENKSVSQFGLEVRKRLLELNMTQRQLAAELKMNEHYLTDILNGRRSGKKYKSKIIEILNIDL